MSAPLMTFRGMNDRALAHLVKWSPEYCDAAASELDRRRRVRAGQVTEETHLAFLLRRLREHRRQWAR